MSCFTGSFLASTLILFPSLRGLLFTKPADVQECGYLSSSGETRQKIRKYFCCFFVFVLFRLCGFFLTNIQTMWLNAYLVVVSWLYHSRHVSPSRNVCAVDSRALVFQNIPQHHECHKNTAYVNEKSELVCVLLNTKNYYFFLYI